MQVCFRVGMKRISLLRRPTARRSGHDLLAFGPDQEILRQCTVFLPRPRWSRRSRWPPRKNSKNPSHVGWRSETQRVISGSSSRVRRSGLRVNRSEDKPAPEGVSVASRASRLAVWSATERSHAHKPRERRSTALSNVFPVVEKKSVIYCNMYCQIVYTKCFISVLLINRCTCLFSTKIVCT